MSARDFSEHRPVVDGGHHDDLRVELDAALREHRELLEDRGRLRISAGFRVGYEDPAYFNRDYKKIFGAPPQRDIARLRNNLSA